MKISRATDYALMLTVCLAKVPSGERTSVKEVAARCNIPQRFLAIIVNRLARSGIIRSAKGMGGGISLARRSSEITVKDVVEAVEGRLDIVDCEREYDVCSMKRICCVKPVWRRARKAIHEILDSVSIADIASASKINVKTVNKKGKGVIYEINGKRQ